MNSLFSFFLLPLLSGLIFLLIVPTLRITSLRYSGYHFLLFSLIIGSGFFIVGSKLIPLARQLLAFLNSHGDPYYSASFLKWYWHIFLDPWGQLGSPKNKFKISDGAAMALLLSTSLGMLFFLAGRSEKLNKRMREYGARRGIASQGNPIEIIFDRAMHDGLPVITTLKSRKVYVGFVQEMVYASVPKKSIKILPIASGYRQKEDLQLQLTTDYSPLLVAMSEYYEKIKESPANSEVEIEVVGKIPITFDSEVFEKLTNDLGVVVCWDEIETVSVWDERVHEIVS
jgi:hypothetical protein